MKGLYSNRNSKSDFVQNGFYELLDDEMDIFIATAFFTETDVINMLVGKKCHIRIVVRLGFPTSPDALEKLLKFPNIEARYYTSRGFHPKFYIFGDKQALVGSANLTRSALTTNQEVVLGLPASDPRFRELSDLFSEYWNDDGVQVLTAQSVESYREIFNQHRDINKRLSELDESIKGKMGNSNFSNINRGARKKSKASIFRASYSKSYQESVSAYNKIEEVFKNQGRKVQDSVIPLRLEIDSFFSFVRDKHATHETWEHEPLGWSDNKKTQLKSLIDEWISISWPHFENRIVETNYPLVLDVFGSETALSEATMKEMVDGLVVLHSFHDRLRFYKGGLETLKKEFIESNDPMKVRKCLTHLLYGSENIVNRMADLIYNEDFKLNEFGQANVQELIGWINHENLPVINGRTTKVLRYFGFDVKQL